VFPIPSYDVRVLLTNRSKYATDLDMRLSDRADCEGWPARFVGNTVLVMLACVTTAFSEEAERKEIAIISSIDHITVTHITNLLKSKGIECTVGGSIVYGGLVANHHAEAAERLLRDDVKKRAYWIKFREEDDPKLVEPRTTQVRLPIAQMLTRAGYKKGTALGRFLRSKELSAKLRAYPFVESMQIREREYLNAKYKHEIGYEVWVTLHSKANDDSKGCRYGYQVWRQGRHILFQGGSEWDKGQPQ